MPDDKQNEELEFNVMPDLGENPPPKTQNAPQIPKPPIIPAIPHQTTANPAPTVKTGASQGKPGGKNRKYLIAGGITLLLALTITFQYAFVKYQAKNETEEKNKIDINVPDQTENKDADNDGLLNEQEQKIGTSPNKADTDGDGLADGDEVNIYSTDPQLTDTDGDTYGDGQEVSNDYSPITNTQNKVGTEEKKKWEGNIAIFGLHEPTPTSLKILRSSATENKPKTYLNNTYKYSLDIPSIFSFREADSQQKVGIFISGQEPVDDDILSDTFTVSTAVKTAEQTLNEWVTAQYSAADYDKLENLTINSVPAVRLLGMSGDSCTANRTLFTKENMIIILTWTCNEITAFGPYYDQIVQSFKFIK